MKQYEDLVKLVNNTAVTGGLDISNEAIAEYQDMIGHSSIEQLREAANGKNNETFYRIYGHAYGTTEAIKFYMKNSDKVAEILTERDEAEFNAEEARRDADKAKDRAEFWKKEADNTAKAATEFETNLKEALRKIELQAREIIELKARLYDLMTADK